MSEGYQLHPGVLFRTTREALIVVHVETDAVYHFEVDTAPFFEFFKNPRLLEDFVLLYQLEDDLGQIQMLEEFCRQLMDMNILQPTTASPLNIPVSSRGDRHFRLHSMIPTRPGAVLDDVAFLYS